MFHTTPRGVSLFQIIIHCDYLLLFVVLPYAALSLWLDTLILWLLLTLRHKLSDARNKVG